MKSSRKKYLSVMSIIVATAMLAPSAHARSIPATAGRTLYGGTLPLPVR
jgi:hypothetical protein